MRKLIIILIIVAVAGAVAWWWFSPDVGTTEGSIRILDSELSFSVWTHTDYYSNSMGYTVGFENTDTGEKANLTWIDSGIDHTSSIKSRYDYYVFGWGTISFPDDLPNGEYKIQIHLKIDENHNSRPLTKTFTLP